MSLDDLFGNPAPAPEPAPPPPGGTDPSATPGLDRPPDFFADRDRFTVVGKQGIVQDPARAGRILAAQQATGLPSDLLDRDDNLDQAEQAMRQKGFDPDAYRRQAPAVARWLAADPTRVGLTANDLPQLAALEQLVRASPDYRYLPDGSIAEDMPGGHYGTVYPDAVALRKALISRGIAADEIQRRSDAMQSTFGSWYQQPVGAALTELAGIARAAAGRGDLGRALGEGEQAISQAQQESMPGMGGTILRGVGSTVADLPLMAMGGPVARAAVGVSKLAASSKLLAPLMQLPEWGGAGWRTALAKQLGPDAVRALGASGGAEAVGAGRAAAEASQVPATLTEALTPAVGATRAALIEKAVTGAAAMQPFAIRGAAEAKLDGQNPLASWAIDTGIAGAFGPVGAARAAVAAAGVKLPDATVAGAKLILEQAGLNAGQNATLELAHALHGELSGEDPGALDADRLWPRLLGSGVIGGLAGTVFSIPEARAHAQEIQRLGLTQALSESAAALHHAQSLSLVADQLEQMESPEHHQDSVRDLMQQLADEGGQPTRYVDAEAWREHFSAQGGDPALEAAKHLGENGDAEYRKQLAAGGQVALPYGSLVSLLRSPHRGWLEDEAREAPGTMNGREARARVQELTKDLGTTPQPADGQPLDDLAGKQALVHEDIQRQLIEAGTEQGVAGHQAQALASLLTTTAKRYGFDPWQLYQGEFGAVRRMLPKVLQSPKVQAELDAMVQRLQAGDYPSERDISSAMTVRGAGAGEDILDATKRLGGLKRKPKGYQGGEYDGRPSIRGIAGDLEPDILAQQLHHEGHGDGTINTMYRLMGEAAEARTRATEREHTPESARMQQQRDAMLALKERLEASGADLAKETHEQLKERIASNLPLTVNGHPVIAADVPYGAGAARDGHVVYIDRRVPRFIEVEGKRIDAWTLIARHELREHRMMTKEGKKYHEAHLHAQHQEDAEVDHMGVSHEAYENALKPHLKEALAQAKPEGIPTDLYEGPYRDMGEEHLLEGRSGAPHQDGPVAEPAHEQPAVRNLVVQHNLTGENLMHAEKMGGLAAPSLAVGRIEHPLTGFGEISLIAHPSLLEQRDVHTFDADVYSPRYPNVRYQVDKKALAKVWDDLGPASKDLNHVLSGELEESDVRRDGVEAFERSKAAQLTFLREQGVKVDLPMNKQGRVESWEASNVMRKLLEPLHDQFKAWARQQFQRVVAGEQIGVETASGNMRYMPHTLDNAVKILTRSVRDGEGFSYGVGNLRALMAKKFKSVQAIQKDRDRIISTTEMDKVKKEVDEEFFNLANTFQSDPRWKDSNRFSGMDRAVDILRDVAKKGPRGLDEWLDQPTNELKQEAVGFLAKLKNLPTEYFETKARRAVGIHEFKAAVVPHDALPEVVDTLRKHGLEISRYERGNDADRARAIADAGDAAGALFQPGQGSDQGPRGRYLPSQRLIELAKGADRSTFLHEVGHWALDFMHRLAARPDAPEGIRQDLATIRAHLGAKDGEAITPEQHELFARTWERYLMEGKAPSAELRGAFARFSSWIGRIYRGMMGYFKGADVTPEVREVFDRLLATDDEIAAARAEVDPGPVFQDREQAGMSEEQWHAYQQARQASIDRGQAILLRQIMAPIRREEQETYQAERDRVHDETTTRIDRLPIYRAIRALQKGEWPEGMEHAEGAAMKLDRADLARYGESLIPSLPGPRQGEAEKANAGARIYTNEGGMSLDDAAEIFGFPDGAALHQALLHAKDRAQLIEAETDAEMRNRYPDPLLDGSSEEAARQALVNDERFHVMAQEAEAIARAAQRVANERQLLRPVARRAIAGMTSDAIDLKALEKARDHARDQMVVAMERLKGMPAGPERSTAQEEAQRLREAWTHADLMVSEARARQVREGKAQAQAAQDQEREMRQNAAALAADVRAMPDELIKAMAAREVRGKPVREINPQLYQRTMIREGKAAVEAMTQLRASKDGDEQIDLYRKALAHRHREMLAAHGYREATRAVERATKGGEFLGTFNDLAKRQRIGKAGGESYLARWTDPRGVPGSKEFLTSDYQDDPARGTADEQAQRAALDAAKARGGEVVRSGPLEQIDQVLEQYDLRRASNASLRKREALREFIARKQAEEEPIDIDPALTADLGTKHWRDLTPDQQQSVVDAVKNLQRLAYARVKARVVAKQAEWKEITGRAVASLEKYGPAPKPQGREPSWWQRHVGDRVGQLLNEWATTQRLNRQFDGFEDGGAWFDAWTRPIHDANAEELRMHAESARAIGDLLGKLYHADGANGIKLALRTWEPILGESVSRWRRIMMALNWGNADGRDRLLKGHGYSEDQVNGILDTLSKPEMEFVQGVLDHINSYWPEIKAKVERTAGLAPEKVEALPIITKHGVFRGGYFPIHYDPKSVVRDAITEQQGKELRSGARLLASTRRGHTEARTGAPDGARLLLEPDVIANHVQQVVHDLAFHETVLDLNRFLRSKDVHGAMVSRVGEGVYRTYQHQIRDLAAGRQLEVGGWGRLIESGRVNVNLASRGFNLMTAAQQLAGMPQAMSRVGPKYFMKAFGVMLHHTVSMDNVFHHVDSQSIEMANRATTRDKNVRDAIGDLSLTGRFKKDVYRWAMYPWMKAFQVLDTHTWLAAHLKAQDEMRARGEDVDLQKAVAIADDTVAQIQGSGALKDLPELMRKGGWVQVFTGNMSWWNAMWNQTAHGANRVAMGARTGSMEHVAKGLGELLVLYGMMPVAWSAMEAALTGKNKDAWGDPGAWAKLMASEEGYTLASQFPFARDLASLFEDGSHARYSGPQGLRSMEYMFNALKGLAPPPESGRHPESWGEHLTSPGTVRAETKAAGVLFGLPVTAMWQVLDGIAEAREQGTSPLWGAVTGPSEQWREEQSHRHR